MLKILKNTLLAILLITLSVLSSYAKNDSGSIIKIGRYPYFANGAKKQIDWIVLEKYEDGTALLLSKYAIDSKPASDKNENTSWDLSYIRKWLNTEFYNSAFNDAEQKGIISSDNDNPINPEYSTKSGRNTKDKIFLLSIQEAVRFFNNNASRKAIATPYAMSHGGFESNVCWWWLRTSGLDNLNMAYVRENGHINYDGETIYDVYGALRVAMKYDLRAMETSAKLNKKGNKAKNDSLKAGDVVKFGSYKYDSDGGSKPIEWNILETYSDGTALLISRHLLEVMPYNSQKDNITWENSSLRAWLNGSFYNEAFSEAEKAGITMTSVINDKSERYGTAGGNNTNDKVFLLSIAEGKKLFQNPGDSVTTPTPYTEGKCNADSNGFCSWWLRSPGLYPNLAAYYEGNGLIAEFGSEVQKTDIAAIRPVLKFKLDVLKKLSGSTGFTPTSMRPLHKTVPLHKEPATEQTENTANTVSQKRGYKPKTKDEYAVNEENNYGKDKNDEKGMHKRRHKEDRPETNDEYAVNEENNYGKDKNDEKGMHKRHHKE